MSCLYNKVFYCLFPEFDDYYKSLRPKLDAEMCNRSQGRNIKMSGEHHGQRVNCRNVWFREFWTQHNKCTFDNSSRKCNGQETISDYEQEGLVPFVGEFSCTMRPVHSLIKT